MANTLELTIQKADRREYYLDLLRILACFLIVMRHTVDNWIGANLSNYTYWHIGLFYNSLAYCAIPVFLMITGYLMLGKIEPYGDFYKKRLLKIGLPFLGWSLLFYYYGNKYDAMGMGPNFIQFFLAKPTFYHLWYVYMLFGIYLVLPPVRKMVSQLNKFDFKYILDIWLFLGGIMPFITRKFGYTLDIVFLFAGYWGYVFLGYFLKLIELGKKQFKFYIGIFVTGYFITFFGTTWLTHKAGQADGFFMDNFILNIVMIAAGLFMIFKYFEPWFKKVISERWKKIIVIVSELTFAIYLAHTLVMDVFLRHFWGLDFGPLFINPFLGIPIFSLAIFILTFILVYIVSKIPFLKMFV